MGQISKNLDKILELFYEYPSKRFTVRAIANSTKIPKSTVHNYLQELKQLRLVTKENTASMSAFFKVKKVNYFIEKLIASGLIEYLEKELIPSCIILFGSFRKGESEKGSDIDLFVETHKKQAPDLKKFEKKLGHEIQLFLEPSINKLPEHLLNNVINGIKLQGSLKAK